MSQRYKGAIISATPPTTSTSSATGEWTLAQQAQAQGASAWPVANPDPYFNQVSLLLHGDGTNGGQNNTFLDSSPPGGYSVYFSGSSQYLSTSSIGAISGDFTIEFWAYKSANGALGYDGVCAAQTGTTLHWMVELSTTRGFLLYNQSGAAFCRNDTTTGINDSSWHHWAVCRSGSSWYLFRDGISLTLTTNAIGTASLAAGTSFLVGAEKDGGATYAFNGTISNFRVVNGTALYTANFTPYYGNLTAITGTSLLTCQGPNIVDNSPNAFPITVNGGATVASPVTITRAGNTTQGTFSPFSLAEGQWSNYIPSAGSTCLKAGTSTSLALGSGDFTVETWVYINALAPSYTTLFDWRTAGSTPPNIPWVGDWNNNGKIAFQSTVSTTVVESNITIPLKQWVHVAVVRSGSTVTMYFNGSSVGSGTSSANLGIETLNIGNPQASNFTPDAYFSNVRLVKGTAVYTSNFTPPTSALTAISGTSLLTCQSNRFVDNSANNFTITPSGDTKVTAWSPFQPALTPYSTSTNGGSGYFDGTGDYLTAPVGSADFGSSAFTVECFLYMTASTSVETLISNYQNSASGWSIQYYSNVIQVALSGDGFDIVGTTTIKTGTWYHIAVSGTSGTGIKLFVNGIQEGSTYTGATSLNSTNPVAIGNLYGYSQYLNGYLSNIRIINGTALYTANFTPPSAPLTAISGTSLLLNCTNAAIYDNAIKNDIETVGDAQISTSVKKYGTGSMYFDGTGDYLKMPSSTEFGYGTGAFTIEFWLYMGSTGTQIFYDQRTTASQNVPTIFYESNSLTYFVAGTNVITGRSLSANTWYHVAISRNGTSTKMFVDGVQTGSTWSDSTSYISSPVYVGGRWDATALMNGYIDDLRITKGVARYTADFVPPIQAFPDY